MHDAETRALLGRIAALPSDWHMAGMASDRVLKAIEDECGRLAPLVRTAETGSGKTTLLFSSVSSRHTVFAMDTGNRSMTAAMESDLLDPARVEFVEGPTQRTLPAYDFDGEYDIVLIDGPHGYPFPDLEFFYFYPHVRKGGLLLVDDIHIPSIGRMYRILKACDMWKLVRTVDNMAFFERTDAPLLDPYGDGWWLQGYNMRLYERGFRRKGLLGALTPGWLRRMIPAPVKRFVSRFV